MNPLYKSSKYFTYSIYISYLIFIFFYIFFVFYYLINENFAKNLHLFLIIGFLPFLYEFLCFLIKLKYITVNENNIIIRSLHNNKEKILDYKEIQSVSQYFLDGYNNVIIEIKYINNETNELTTIIVLPELITPKEDNYVLIRFRARPEINITKYIKGEVAKINSNFLSENIYSPYLYVVKRLVIFYIYFIIFMYIFFKF